MASGCSIGTMTVTTRERPADQIADRRNRRHSRGDPHRLTATGGIAALFPPHPARHNSSRTHRRHRRHAFRFAWTEYLPTPFRRLGPCGRGCRNYVGRVVISTRTRGVLTAPSHGLTSDEPLAIPGLDICSRGVDRQPSWDSQPVRDGVSRPPLSSQSSSSRRTHR